MKKLFFLILAVPLLSFSPFLQGAVSETHGFFSFNYLKGEKQSEFAGGSFQNLRAGITFSGEVAPKFGYALEFQFREASQLEIEQALAGYIPSEAFQLKLGLYLVPFGKYNQGNRPYQTRLVQAPLPFQEIYPYSWRDLGVLVEGKVGFFLYSAYAGNGLAEAENLKAAQQLRDNNKDKGKGLRLGLFLSSQLEVGFSYYWGKYDKDNKRNLTLQGFHGSWLTDSFSIIGEYVRADLKNPEPFSQGQAEGFFLILSLNLGKLQPLAGYESLRYNDSFHGPGFRGPDVSGAGISEEKNCWVLGFVYTISLNFNLKAEYDLNREKPLELKDDVFRAQATLFF